MMKIKYGKYFFFYHLCLIDWGGVEPGEDNDYSSGDEGYSSEQDLRDNEK